mgnify:CR=1 FL=1
MIKADILREFRPIYTYPNGCGVSLSGIVEKIEEFANEYQIPVAFAPDQIKYGGLFNSRVIDCMILFHPEHPKDYFKFAISIDYMGESACVSVNDFGESKNLKKLATRENAKKNAKTGAKFGLLKAENGSEMAAALYVLGKGALGGVLSLGGTKAKQAEENNYYEAIQLMLDEIVQ